MDGPSPTTGLRGEAGPVAPASISSTRRARRPRSPRDLVVVIGSSTGGPQALHRVAQDLPGDFPAPVVIVQHMPSGFTRSLAEHLDAVSALRVTEAVVDDRLEVGRLLVAPGGHHMVFDVQRRVRLHQDPAVNGVRPAVDVTMESLAALPGVQVLGVVLTGMGRDGMNGARAVRDAGGRVLAEDPSTCIVYGMPRAVIEAGHADEVIPLDRMGDAIVRSVAALTC